MARRLITWRRRNQFGASAVEYGLLVAAIAALIAVTLFTLGGPTIGMFKGVCDDMATQQSGTTCP